MVLTRRRWEGHGSHPRVAAGSYGCGETSMPSSPLSERSVCHSPSPSVTPQSAAATQSPLMHPSIPATMARRSLTWSPLQKEDMSSCSPYMVLKRPRSPPPQGPLLFFWTSIHWAYASIHLPPYPSSCLSTSLFDSLSLPLVCMLTEDSSTAFVCNQYVVQLSVEKINNSHQRFQRFTIKLHAGGHLKLSISCMQVKCHMIKSIPLKGFCFPLHFSPISSSHRSFLCSQPPREDYRSFQRTNYPAWPWMSLWTAVCLWSTRLSVPPQKYREMSGLDSSIKHIRNTFFYIFIYINDQSVCLAVTSCAIGWALNLAGQHLCVGVCIRHIYICIHAYIIAMHVCVWMHLCARACGQKYRSVHPALPPSVLKQATGHLTHTHTQPSMQTYSSVLVCFYWDLYRKISPWCLCNTVVYIVCHQEVEIKKK